MALRTHLENIDELVQLHDSRLYALEKSFQQELKVMQNDFYHEKETMLGNITTFFCGLIFGAFTYISVIKKYLFKLTPTVPTL